jgi:hypothetical protein
MEHRAATFLPSRHGLRFANSWPAGPALSLRTPAGQVGIGNAARGLCGGMVFAALDYWHAGLVPPDPQPGPGDQLFRFIVRRLIDSWRVPSGVLRYYGWMLAPGTSARRTIRRHWPRVRASIDAGLPVPLGVVTVASPNPLLLGYNHQVLAYAYESLPGSTGPAGTGRAGTGPADSGPAGTVRVRVYDPNSGPDDGILIEFDPVRPDPTGFAHNLRIGRPVLGFFVTRYVPSRPPG